MTLLMICGFLMTSLVQGSAPTPSVREHEIKAAQTPRAICMDRDDSVRGAERASGNSCCACMCPCLLADKTFPTLEEMKVVSFIPLKKAEEGERDTPREAVLKFL